MSAYTPPIDDLRFVLEELADLDSIRVLPGYEEVQSDLVDAILSEAGKVAVQVLAPLNRVGDEGGARLEAGLVVTPPGWQEAFQTFVAGGWSGLMFDPKFGGQGLPRVVSTAVQEMWESSNMSFALWLLLTQAAAEAISIIGTAEQKSVYLSKLVRGEWTGTMNLTEPQAGSDLSAISAIAVPEESGHYLLSGQKMFITYGDHDLAENIIHLVLARTPDAPDGVKGISLFIVPKFIPDSVGEPGLRNEVRCVSLEHKLGIHGSPTALMSYGEDRGAVAYLVGEVNRGLEYMFIMMNAARHAVGVEGYGIADRAYQQALAYSQERIQGRSVGQRDGARVAIINHPDIQRMLLEMRCQIEAMRALGCCTAAAMDRAERHPEAQVRQQQQRRVDVLIPIVKGWSTEVGNQITSQALQVHGGMGFMEETGAAQHYRDARITTIYEGTTGIQASDLVGRKLLRDGGEMVREVIADIREDLLSIRNTRNEASDVAGHVEEALSDLEDSTAWMLESAGRDQRIPFAASFDYLMMFGTVVGGWQMACAAGAAAQRLDGGRGDARFNREKLATARCYVHQILPRVRGFSVQIRCGAEAVVAAGDIVF